MSGSLFVSSLLSGSLFVSSLMSGSLFASLARAEANVVGDIVGNIVRNHLPAEALEGSQVTRSSRPYFSHERESLQRLSMGPSPTQEGIPGTHGIPDPKALTEGAYSTASLLQRAIEEANRIPDDGPRIQHYERMAIRIVRKSGTNPWEQTVRMTMNRAVDVTKGALGIAGNNPELVSAWCANFYRMNFELASAYVNNPNKLEEGDRSNRQSFAQALSIAEYGRIYAQLLIRASASLTSGSSKAVIRLKLLGFLGWDLNLDLRRADSNLKELLADIFELQTEDQDYSVVLKSLELGEEPNSSSMSRLLSKISIILDRVAPAFQRAGIPLTGSVTNRNY